LLLLPFFGFERRFMIVADTRSREQGFLRAIGTRKIQREP